jgi:ankyrin repeat protein
MGAFCFFLLISFNSNAADLNDDLLSAAFQGDTETVKTLLSKGASPNSEDDGGTSALIGAARNGHSAIINALLAKGADPNVKNTNGDSALTLAKMKEHENTVKILEAAGTKEYLIALPFSAPVFL